MIRVKLYELDYRPQFSGHETFPLRYGWLKKAYDAVQESSQDIKPTIFSRPEAIADFGVGKNMVLSIKHWAIMTGIISEPNSKGIIKTTKLGNFIFSSSLRQPFAFARDFSICHRRSFVDVSLRLFFGFLSQSAQNFLGCNRQILYAHADGIVNGIADCRGKGHVARLPDALGTERAVVMGLFH